MLSAIAWLPLIGPIVEGFFGFLNKRSDNALEKYKTGVSADTEDAKTSARIIEATQDDICIRFMRDAVCFPVVVWSMLIGWDTIIAKKWPELMWHVEKYPESVAYLPYAVLVFLLGNVGINAWKRR